MLISSTNLLIGSPRIKRAPSANERRIMRQVMRLPQVQTITAQELKNKTESTANYGNPEKCGSVVVNVLGKKYYDDCSIKGSICVPLYDLCKEAKVWEQRGWHKSKEFIVYCALDECDASEKAFYMLKGMGFEKVLAYEGGIREWHLLGYPTAGECSFDYLQQDWVPETRSCVCFMCEMTMDDVKQGIMPKNFR